MHWLEQTQVPNHAEMVALAVGVVAESDLGKAASLISGMEDGSLRDKATASLTASWAAKDPGAALAWASQLAPGPGRNNSISHALSLWARKDVNAAAEWAKSAPAGSVPPQAYTIIAQDFGKDLPAVASWMNELPDGPAILALDAMFTFSREQDVTAALALPTGKYKVSIVEKASTTVVQMRPDQALAWALALPDAAQRQQMRKLVEAIEPTEQYSNWNGMNKQKKAEILQRMK